MVKKFGDVSRENLENIIENRDSKTFSVADSHVRALKKALEYIDFLEREIEHQKKTNEYFRKQREVEGDFWAGLLGHLEPHIQMLIEEKLMDRRNEDEW